MSASAYKPTIGLEIHAELKTRTKMFCDSANDPEEKEPNVNICPVCMAHPGTLPVINKEAVRHVLRVGTALRGTLANYTEFDRKSYFYPDIPKGFQISQYEYPLVSGGELHGIAVTRVHLEEDTARSVHHANKSLVDFNRAGVPLMELVTEPVIHDAKTAGDFARELQLLLRTLGAGDANLEKGEMRVEANISVSKDETLGTKVEVKNINSFKAVERAIAYEIERQSSVLDAGGKVTQETRGWNEDKEETFAQRLKEGSADYRYFPEPDLPKLVLSELPEWKFETLREGLPELPWEKHARYVQVGIPEGDAETILASKERSDYFDNVLEEIGTKHALIKHATNYLINDIGDSEPPALSAFLELIEMVEDARLSSRGAKDTLRIVLAEGAVSSLAIATREGFLQVNDTGALEDVVRKVIALNEGIVAEYKAGKVSVLQYLVGQAMKESKGAGNPALLKSILEESLH